MFWIGIVTALLLAFGPLTPVHAQVVEPNFGIGAIGLDATHLALTASARIHLARRFSLDPELLYAQGSNRITRTRVIQFGPALAFALFRGRIAPYVIGGPHFGQVRRTFYCQFPSRCVVPYTSFPWTSGSAGGGVRLYHDKFFLSPEFRMIGDKDGVYWRFTANIGMALGTR
jgi:hypothetical protein